MNCVSFSTLICLILLLEETLHATSEIAKLLLNQNRLSLVNEFTQFL